MSEFWKIVLIGVGGSIGAVSRYLISSALLSRFGTGFPWGTLSVNLLGCFLMGLLLGVGWHSNSRVFVFLAIGILGSLTTFSAFSAETLRFANDAKYEYLILNVLANVGGSLLAAWTGFILASFMSAAGHTRSIDS